MIGAERTLVESPDLESSGEAYASRFAGPAGEFLLEVQTNVVRDMLAPLGGGRALDVGGGHGQLVEPLLDANYHVTVLGSTPDGWGRARALYRDRGVAFAAGSLVDPPFEDRSFEVVTAFRMLAHVSDWSAMVRGLCRVARDAVIVDFAVPTSVNRLAPRLFALKQRIEGSARPYRTISRAHLAMVLSSCGFEQWTSVPQLSLPLALHRALQMPAFSRVSEEWLRRSGITRRFGSPVVLCARRTEGREG